jgi:type IV fimbrial biogenesis protein FimT
MGGFMGSSANQGIPVQANSRALAAFAQRGFTLVEMLVVLAIAVIIASIAIPSYRTMMNTTRVSDAATSLHGALMLARTEALKRNRRVVVCKISNVVPAPPARPACDASVSTRANMGWANGWMTFVDPNGNNTLDANEELIFVQNNLAKNAGDGAILPSVAQEFIVFGAMGQSFMAMNFLLAGADANLDRAVCIAAGGRVRVGKAPNCP